MKQAHSEPTFETYTVVDPADTGANANYQIACDKCGVIGVKNLSGPEPEDPDRHGNRRSFFECVECGERGHIVSGRHGGSEIVGHFSKVPDEHVPTPHADQLAEVLVDRFDTHGVSDDDVDVHTNDRVTVNIVGEGDRRVENTTSRLLSTARREGWYSSSVDFEAGAITFNRDRFGDTLRDDARRR